MKEKVGYKICVINIIEGFYIFCLFIGIFMDVVLVILGV